jgi:hypothetical protein
MKKLFILSFLAGFIFSTGIAFAGSVPVTTKTAPSIKQFIKKHGLPTKSFNVNPTTALEYCKSNGKKIETFARANHGKAFYIKGGDDIAVVYGGKAKFFTAIDCRVYFFKNNKLTNF